MLFNSKDWVIITPLISNSVYALRLHIPFKRKKKTSRFDIALRTHCITDVSDVETRRCNNANLNYGPSSFPSPRHRVVPINWRELGESHVKEGVVHLPLRRPKTPHLFRCKCMCIASMYPVLAASANATAASPTIFRY